MAASLAFPALGINVPPPAFARQIQQLVVNVGHDIDEVVSRLVLSLW